MNKNYEIKQYIRKKVYAKFENELAAIDAERNAAHKKYDELIEDCKKIVAQKLFKEYGKKAANITIYVTEHENDWINSNSYSCFVTSSLTAKIDDINKRIDDITDDVMLHVLIEKKPDIDKLIEGAINNV